MPRKKKQIHRRNEGESHVEKIKVYAPAYAISPGQRKRAKGLYNKDIWEKGCL